MRFVLRSLFDDNVIELNSDNENDALEEALDELGYTLEMIDDCNLEGYCYDE